MERERIERERAAQEAREAAERLKEEARLKRIEEEDAKLAAIKARDDAARKVLDDAAVVFQKNVRRKQVMAQKLLAGKKKKGKKGKKGKKKK